MTKKTTEFDSPWQKIIQLFIKEFLLFFFPQISGYLFIIIASMIVMDQMS